MKSLIRNAFAASAAVLLLAAPSFAQVKDYRDIKAQPLRKAQFPQPKRIQLANGMVIFLMEDHELPLIRGTARIRGGARDVSGEKAGLTSILGQSWRTGGTETRTGDQLDEQLESRAARIETGGGVDSTTISMDVLKQDFDFVFPIFVDVLRNPAFRQDKIDLAKTGARTAISRRNDDPGSILQREITRLGYGKDSPYARQTEYATINAITRDDIIGFHRAYVHPNNIILGFVGDFDSARMEQQLRQAFGSWARGPQAPKAPQDVRPAQPGIYFVPKDDVTQGNIAVVHGGAPLRNSPDYAALQVMNEILSGGFSGRLMQRLRSERGLTYGVGGGVSTEWDYPGLFRINMATKSGTTLESVTALREQINLLTTGEITQNELQLAKESILNAYVFTADSRADVINQAMLLEFYGYPADFYTRYPSLIEKVTKEDVERVARRYVNPNNLAVLVVGKESDFERPLGSLGTVTPIDITIPEPNAPAASSGSTQNPGGSASAAPAPSAASTAAGKALAQKVLQFVGGKSAVDSVQSLRVTTALNMKTPQGDMQMDRVRVTRYPDSQRDVMRLPMGEMTTVLSPDAAFVITPMGTQDLPSSQRANQMQELKTDPIAILKNIDNPKYTFTAGATETINGTQAQVLDINADGATVRWLVDPATGRLLRKVSQARGPQPGEQITDYGDWKSFGAIMYPTSATVHVGGEQVATGTSSAVEINPVLEGNLFTKPSA
ncbi:MAG TPA: pitrilysin family protein [Thermoanaerobaculia bacterium]